jgi:hypothetical protein
MNLRAIKAVAHIMETYEFFFGSLFFVFFSGRKVDEEGTGEGKERK